MTRPTTAPVWATDGGTTLEPSAPQKAAGFAAGTRPPARWMNWWMNQVYSWIADLATYGGEVHNVRSATYGALGDGSNNDTTAIQAAITAATAAGGGTVFLPPGTYKITAALVIDSSKIAFVGAGASTVLAPTHTSGDVITVGSGGSSMTDGRIADLVITPSTLMGANTLIGVNLRKALRYTVEKLQISNCGSSAVAVQEYGNTLKGNYLVSSTRGVFLYPNTYLNKLEANEIYLCTTGLEIRDAYSVWVNQDWIHGCTKGAYILAVNAVTANIYLNCHFNANPLSVHCVGASNTYRVKGVTITGLINSSSAAAAGPAITRAYTDNLCLRDLVFLGLTYTAGVSLYPLVSSDAYSHGLTMENLYVDGKPYLDPTSLVPALNTPMQPQNWLTDGGMEVWTSPTELTNWTADNATVAQDGDPDAGEYCAEVTYVDAGACIYQVVSLPIQYYGKAVPFCIKAAVKHDGAGTGMWIKATPRDNGAVQQGDISEATGLTTAEYQTAVGCYGVTNADTTNILVELGCNTGSVGKFDSVALYFGYTPWNWGEQTL